MVKKKKSQNSQKQRKIGRVTQQLSEKQKAESKWIGLHFIKLKINQTLTFNKQCLKMLTQQPKHKRKK